MHLLGRLVLLDVVVVGITAVYVTNYFLLRALYDRPDFTKCNWRQRLLWGVGLVIPVAGVAVLLLATVVVILVFAIVFFGLLINGAARRSNPT